MCRSSVGSQTRHRHRNGGMRGEKWVEGWRGRQRENEDEDEEEDGGEEGEEEGDLRHSREERAGV